MLFSHETKKENIMKKGKGYSRRKFVKQNTMVGIGATVAMSISPTILAKCATDTGTPAILGGEKIRTKGWPDWPIWDPATDEAQVIEVLRSGV
jgi:perosamine synthetase